MKKLFILFASFLFSLHTMYSQCNNSDFESTAPATYTSATSLTGWTVSSQTVTSCNTSTVWTPGSPEFSIVATPINSVSYLGWLSNSPRGGTVVAQVNDFTANSQATRLTHAISVTTLNPIFQFCYAGIWQNGGHNCCEEAGFKVRLIDQQGIYSTCPSYTLGGSGCQFVPTYDVTSGVTWTDWQTKYFDLNQYIGTTITIEVTVNDCTYGDHYGTVFFDAGCITANLGSCNCVTEGMQYNMGCSSSGEAIMAAPLGYGAYEWVAPQGYSITAAQSTVATLSVTNAVAGNVYTVNLTTPDGFCVHAIHYSLTSIPLSILGIGASSTCAGGSTGSATVIASGNANGYNYLWVNASNSVVGTSMTVNNLPAGVYQVSVSAWGTLSAVCVPAVTTITVSVRPPVAQIILKTYCDNEAYLFAPLNQSYSNYQWYENSLSAISGSLGGNSTTITVKTPSANPHYYVAYTNALGCRDSVQFTLFLSNPGSLLVTSISTICPGANNGTVTLQMTASSGASPGHNYFSMISTGTTSSYSSTLATGTATNFPALNLSAGGTYSVDSFDGSCKYSQTFTVPVNIFDYTLAATPSPTVCSGSTQAHANFPSAPAQGQYSYSWSPTTNLLGSTAQNVIITPVVPSGFVINTIYTVVVTSSLANCSVTKTLAITGINLPTPIINLVPVLCSNDLPYAPLASPLGGTFITIGNNVFNGQILPANSNIGVNSFSYATSLGPCNAKSSATYIVKSPPQISISGNTLICDNQSVSFLASGASTYSWSTQATGPVISVTPAATTNYSVQGYDVNTTCSNTSSITVTVVSTPTLSITGQTMICLGATVILVASGATSYLWNTGSTSSSLNVSPLANTAYTVKGISSLGACTTTQSIVVNLSSCSILGLNESILEDLVSVYPNPTTGEINLRSDVEVSFKLQDALGRIIREEKTADKNFTFDLRSYSNGIYFLKIYYKAESKTLKLVKNG